MRRNANPIGRRVKIALGLMAGVLTVLAAQPVAGGVLFEVLQHAR